MSNASAPKVSALAALVLLITINLFNYIDRHVLQAVEPEIREELLKEEGATGPLEESEDAKFWMGILAMAFLLSYIAFAPVFGMMADRWSRWGLIGFGVILWSLASGASGLPWHDWGFSLSMSYWLMLLTRCLVGVGEAAYGPVAPAMIADLYPTERRGKVLAFFYLAFPVGGALGYALGEIVKNLADWHYAFYCVVPPGLLLGLWCFLMREPPRGQEDRPADEGAIREGEPPIAPIHTDRKARLSDYWFLLQTPSYLCNTLGMTFMAFAIGGLAFWMSAYLKETSAPDLAGIQPRTVFGGITALAGLFSTIAGGLLGDWLRPRFAGSYFIVSGVALMLGFPMILAMLWAPYPLKWACIFMAVFLLFFNTGPTNTILANVTHPLLRARAYGLNILIIHALGDAISPSLIGWIAGTEHLDFGFIIVSLAMLAGGVCWLIGARFLARDTALAPTRLPT